MERASVQQRHNTIDFTSESQFQEYIAQHLPNGTGLFRRVAAFITSQYISLQLTLISHSRIVIDV